MQPDYRTTNVFFQVVNDKIIDTIHAQFPDAVKQIKGFARKFDQGNALDSARRVWMFQRNNIRYKRDPDANQMIRTPARFVADRTGDCKSYSLFAAAALASMGYPVRFRYASYKLDDPTPTHVYVVTETENGDDIIVDGVFNQFNAEKAPAFFKDYRMPISVLSGIGSRRSERRRRQGGRSQAGIILSFISSPFTSPDKRRQAAKDLQTVIVNSRGIPGALTVALSPNRAAFLQCVKLNVFGLANRLTLAINRGKSTQVKTWWEKSGGTWSALTNAIAKGQKKKPILPGKAGKNAYNLTTGNAATGEASKSFDGKLKNASITGRAIVNGIGEPATAGATAAIIAAGTLIGSVVALLKQIGVGEGDPNNPTDGTLDKVEGYLNSLGIPTGDVVSQLEVEDPGVDDEGGIMKWLLIGAAAFVAIKLIK